MNNPEKKETNAIQPSPKKSMWRGIGIAFSTFAVIVLICIFFIVNNYYLQNMTRANGAQNNFEQIQQKMNAMDQQIQQLTETIKNQDQTLNALRQTQSGFNRDQWKVIEAEFLVKLANDKLRFENNFSQAITLLQNADMEIRDLNDARLITVRKALADDIASLQTAVPLDVTGLYLRISALNEQINKLPLINKPEEQSIQAEPIANANLPWWKRAVQQTSEALSKIVIVRYHEKTTPLLMPTQQDFLYQNIHAAMEKSMWALLHQKPEIYRASLQQTMQWIKTYFVNDSPATQNMLTNLTQLEQIDINPSAPKLTGSLQAFQEYFASH